MQGPVCILFSQNIVMWQSSSWILPMSLLALVDDPLWEKWMLHWEEWIIIFWLLKLRIPVFFRVSKWHQISKELFNTISYWIFFFLICEGFFFKWQCLEMNWMISKIYCHVIWLFKSKKKNFIVKGLLNLVTDLSCGLY